MSSTLGWSPQILAAGRNEGMKKGGKEEERAMGEEINRLTLFTLLTHTQTEAVPAMKQNMLTRRINPQSILKI